jgi:transcriptional regulator with XRE-family HTH domain
MNTGVPAGSEQPVPALRNSVVEPTVLRMLLGTQLRRLREAAGITPEQAAYEIRASRSKISRMESGRGKFKDRDLADLLTFYGVADGQQRSSFRSLARQSNQADWWAKYSGILPDWFEPYLGLESAASTIRSLDIQFVPGLFQTDDYARAAIRLGHPSDTAEQIEHRVGLRIKRQDLIGKPTPPRIWSVMDEAVLRRPVGGPEVMRAQLDYLAKMALLPHVTIQVLPFARGGHSGESGSFTVLRFKEHDLPDLVYIEQLTSAIYLEQRAEVELYLAVMDQLSGEALTPAATVDFIKQIAEDV